MRGTLEKGHDPEQVTVFYSREAMFSQGSISLA